MKPVDGGWQGVIVHIMCGGVRVIIFGRAALLNVVLMMVGHVAYNRCC